MTKFVAMYLRVSTFDQAHNGYGLGDQEVQCRKYIDLYFPNDEVKITRMMDILLKIFQDLR